jgi:hypothetical protein
VHFVGFISFTTISSSVRTLLQAVVSVGSVQTALHKVNQFKACLLTLSYGADDFGKIWSICGQNEIQNTTRTMNTNKDNYRYNFTAYFSIHVNKNITPEKK